MMEVIEVAAGIIVHEGRYLIARRKAGVHLGGLWEFPGGKRETGETLEECLHRELREELNVRIGPPTPFQVVRHEYPEKIVELPADAPVGQSFAQWLGLPDACIEI